jgi:RHS repeat-associated protein
MNDENQRTFLRSDPVHANTAEGPVLIDSPGGDGWILDSETHYIYDGNRVIQERDGSNVPTVSYTRGNDLSGSLDGAGGIGGLLARSHGYSSGNWSTHSFYHADGNGNITYMLNSSQSVVASYRYDPFGNIISQSGSLADANVYRFSSKEIHVASGMYYYLYRFYDPNLQRWINRDSIRELGFEALRAHYTRKGKPTRRDGDNLYKFVENDPVSKWDYLGLDNPGCDWPVTGIPCILPGAADCYLRCCAQHDVCFHDNHCKALTSWLELPCPTRCGGCARQVLGCFAGCLSGGSGPGYPPYYCAASDTYYYNWADIPPSCYEGQTKPPKPDCYP